MKRERKVYLGLGANLKDKRLQLQQAVSMLHQSEGIEVCRLSSLYQTAPLGYVDQPDFLNAVVEIQTSLSPRELLEVVLGIEQKLHRVRQIRFGPRTIDIDILLYDNQMINQEDLSIPHPRMTERAFVLIPLFEIAGNVIIPGVKGTVEERIKALSTKQMVKISPLLWG